MEWLYKLYALVGPLSLRDEEGLIAKGLAAKEAKAYLDDTEETTVYGEDGRGWVWYVDGEVAAYAEWLEGLL